MSVSLKVSAGDRVRVLAGCRQVQAGLGAVKFTRDRPVLDSVRVSVGADGSVLLAATNSYVLTIVELPAVLVSWGGGVPDVFEVLVPREGWKEVVSTLHKGRGDVLVSVDGGRMSVDCGDLGVSVELRDGEFPNVERLVTDCATDMDGAGSCDARFGMSGHVLEVLAKVACLAHKEPVAVVELGSTGLKPLTLRCGDAYVLAMPAKLMD